MIKLEKGAPVRVRLHTGEVVEAVYDRAAYPSFKNSHWVKLNGNPCYVSSGEPHQETQFDHACVRFVGNPCDLVPVGVSV